MQCTFLKSINLQSSSIELQFLECKHEQAGECSLAVSPGGKGNGFDNHKAFICNSQGTRMQHTDSHGRKILIWFPKHVIWALKHYSDIGIYYQVKKLCKCFCLDMLWFHFISFGLNNKLTDKNSSWVFHICKTKY